MVKTTEEVRSSRAGGSRVQPRKSGGSGISAPLIALGLTAAILVGGYLGVCAYAKSQDVFYGSYSVNGVDLGGMTVEEAATALAADLPARTVTIKSTQNPADEGWPGEATGSVTLGDLGYTPERCAAIAQSRYDKQQSGGFFSGGARFLSSLTASGSGNVTLEERDDEAFQAGVASLASTLALEPQHGTYEAQGSMVSITKPANGRSVEPSVLASALEEAIEKGGDQMEARVPFQTQKADPISAQAVHDEMAGEMRNAGYDAATGSIIPEQVGADFDVAQAQRLLNDAAPGETVTIEAQIHEPAVTAEQLKAVLFRDVLGECTTHVSGTAARIGNVKLASAAFNGTVLNSGDVFSYNGTVGQRTAAKGYKAAPAYVQGETVNEIGGGVCQPSSTLYYACLLANLEITERSAHRYIPAYITRGMDATVSWGGPDYKFTNNTDYPIKLVTSYANNYLTVKIYGTKVDDITVKMTYETLSTTPFKEVEQVDNSLSPGARQVKVTPYTGYRVKTYRNLYDGNGTLISSDFEATSDYKSRDRVVVVGPAAATGTDTPAVGTDTPATGTDTPATGTETPGTTTPPADTGTPSTGTTTPPETNDPANETPTPPPQETPETPETPAPSEDEGFQPILVNPDGGL